MVIYVLYVLCLLAEQNDYVATLCQEAFGMLRFLLMIGGFMYFFVGGMDFDDLERKIAEYEHQTLVNAAV